MNDFVMPLIIIAFSGHTSCKYTIPVIDFKRGVNVTRLRLAHESENKSVNLLNDGVLVYADT